MDSNIHRYLVARIDLSFRRELKMGKVVPLTHTDKVCYHHWNARYNTFKEHTIRHQELEKYHE